MATRPGSELRGPEASRPVLLFGANGRLGSALRRALADRRVVNVAWKDALQWLDPSDEAAQRARIRAHISRIGAGDIDILFAGGMTDPAQPLQRLLLSNADFPRSVIAATRDTPGHRYITFGTIMERFGGAIAAKNAYVASKIELGRWVEAQTRQDGEIASLNGRIAHLQIHTLYGGGEPAPHMFLGQLVAALRSGQSFAMSPGLQLREYHHVDDVAGSVARFLSSPSWPREPVVALSSGRPVQLAVLARAIFAAVGRNAGLRVGDLPVSEAENLNQTFAPAPPWLLEPSREPLSGVCAWVNSLLGATRP